MGGGVGEKRIVAPFPSSQPHPNVEWCASSLIVTDVERSWTIEGFGVVSEGVVVASRESITMWPWCPVTAKSVTTISRTVALPSASNAKSSNKAV